MKRMRLRGERGGATVEFAIIAVVLLTIVFGIIEFGILMFDKHILTNASREGARAGIVMRATRVPDRATVTTDPPCFLDAYQILANGDCVPAGIIDIVERYSEENMVTFGTPNDPSVNVTRTWLTKNPPVLKSGDELVVEVTYNFDFLFLSSIGLGQIPLTAETRMRME